jgi:16S rRNA (cytosine967-C5)-methyltransferase
MQSANERYAAIRILGKYHPQKSNLSRLLNTSLEPRNKRESEIPEAKRRGIDEESGGLLSKGFIRDLVWGTVCRLNTLDYVVDRYYGSGKPLENSVRNILRLGIYQLIFAGDIPDYAAVNETVKLAGMIKRPAAAKLINAVLRQVIRDRGKLFDRTDFRDEAKYISVLESHPAWLVSRWLKRFGEDETRELCGAGNVRPRVTLRVNTLKVSRETFLESLKGNSIKADPSALSADGVYLADRTELEKIPGYGLGFFAVQDEGSQLASYMLGPLPGEKILDLCCGACVKSTHIAQLARNGCEITAVDNSASQLKLAEDNIRKLGAKNIRLVNSDAGSFTGFEADRILIDAPCSGFGVIRRKPDIKWNRTEKDVAGRFPRLQNEILANAAGLVKKDGVILYVTCTTEPEENEEIIDGFLRKNTNFSAEPYFRSLPHKYAMDGFFAAKLKRIS